MKDARGHGSDQRGGGTARGQVYRDAVSRVQGAMGTWAKGIVDSQATLAAHQTGVGELKTTAQMMAEHDKIWGTNKSTNPRADEDPRAAMARIWK
jgi:hypothetical protein